MVLSFISDKILWKTPFFSGFSAPIYKLGILTLPNPNYVQHWGEDLTRNAPMTQRLCGKYKTHRPEHRAQEQAGPQLWPFTHLCTFSSQSSSMDFWSVSTTKNLNVHMCVLERVCLCECKGTGSKTGESAPICPGPAYCSLGPSKASWQSFLPLVSSFHLCPSSSLEG